MAKKKQKSPAEILSQEKIDSGVMMIPDKDTTYGVMKTNIRVMRNILDLTQGDVAKATGLSESCLCKIEKGREPLVSTAFVIADFYGKEVTEIWDIKRLNKDT